MTDQSARTLLITGASSGIGAATARAASAKGWNVILLARRKDRLEELASEIGEGALAIECDVTDRDTLQSAIARTVETYGGPGAGSKLKKAEELGIEVMDEAGWAAIVQAAG